MGLAEVATKGPFHDGITDPETSLMSESIPGNMDEATTTIGPAGEFYTMPIVTEEATEFTVVQTPTEAPTVRNPRLSPKLLSPPSRGVIEPIAITAALVLVLSLTALFCVAARGTLGPCLGALCRRTKKRRDEAVILMVGQAGVAKSLPSDTE